MSSQKVADADEGVSVPGEKFSPCLGGSVRGFRQDGSRQFDQLRLVATAQTSLAYIDQTVNESSRIFESTVSAIEEYTRSPANL